MPRLRLSAPTPAGRPGAPCNFRPSSLLLPRRGRREADRSRTYSCSTPAGGDDEERSRFRVAAHQMIKDFEKSLGKVMDTFSYKGENVDDVSDSKPESSHARHTKGNKKGASRKGKCIASAQDLDSSEDTFDEDFVVDLDDSDQSGSDSGTDLADEDDGADLDDEDDFVERGPEPKKRRYAKEIKKVPNVMNRASDLNKARKVSVKESKEQKNVEASKLSVKETKRQKIVEARKVSDKDRKKQKTVEAKQTPTVKPLDLKKASKVSLRESKKRKIVECQQTVVDLELEVDEQEESKRKQAANKEATNIKRAQNSANLRERDAGSSKVCFDQSVNVVVKDRDMFSGPNENLLRKPRGKSARVALPVMIDRLKKDFVPQGEVSPTQLATNESLPLACGQGLEVTSKVVGNAPTLVVCTLANLSIYDTDSACSGDLKNAEGLRTGDVSNSVAVDVDKSADLEHKEAAQAVLEPALLQTTTCVGKEEANNVDAEKSVVFNPDLVPKEKNQSVLESTIVSVANQQASGATEDPFAQKDAQISLEAPSESKKKAILVLKSSKPLY